MIQVSRSKCRKNIHDAFRVSMATLIFFTGGFVSVDLFDLVPIDYFIMGLWLVISPLIFCSTKKIYVGGKDTTRLICFITVSLASVFWSRFPFESFAYSIRFLLLLGMYFMLQNFNDFESIEKLIKNIITIVFWLSIISIVRFALQPNMFYGRYYFCVIERGDPNYTALSLIVAASYSYYFARRDKQTSFRYALLTMYFFGLFLVTFSRGMFLALFLTLLIAFWPIMKRTARRYRKLLLSVTSLIIAILPLGVLLAWDKLVILLRFETLFSGAGRFDIWKRALKALAERPILGHGAGTLRFVVTMDHSTFTPGLVAHNSWIEIAVGVGLVGAMFLVAYVLQVIRRLIMCRRHKRHDALFVNITLWLFTFALFAMLSINIETSRYLWLLMGLSGFLSKGLGVRDRFIVFRR